MIAVLIFVILYMAISAWDVVRVNDLFGRMVDPGRGKSSGPQPEPAPRLVINLPPSNRHS
jgi:hypothetical protein